MGSGIKLRCCEARSILSEDLFESTQEDGGQRRRCLDLVEHFYRQIRYGCVNAECQTPSCLSFRKRRARESYYRTPTQVTARALATSLACENDAAAKLCPHEPCSNCDPKDLAFPTSRNLGLSGVTDSLSTDTLLEFCKNPGHFQAPNEISAFNKDQDGNQHLLNPSQKGHRQPESFWAHPRERLDSKSLMQQVFNTVSWKEAAQFEVRENHHRLSKVPLLNIRPPEGTNGSDGGILKGGVRNTVDNPEASTLLKEDTSLTAECHNAVRDSVKHTPACTAFETRKDFKTLSRITGGTLAALLSCLDEEAGGLRPRKFEYSARPASRNESLTSEPARQLQSIYEFARRSIAYVFSNPGALIRSFKCDAMLDSKVESILCDGSDFHLLQDLPTITIEQLVTHFQSLRVKLYRHPRLLPYCLSTGLEQCYPRSATARDRNREPLNHGVASRQLNALHVGHILKVGLATMISCMTPYRSAKQALSKNDQECLKRCTSFFNVSTDNYTLSERCLFSEGLDLEARRHVVHHVRDFENDSAYACMRAMLRVFYAWRYCDDGSATEQESRNNAFSFTGDLVDYLVVGNSFEPGEVPGSTLPKIILMWAQMILRREWNNGAVFQKASTFGCAIDFISLLRENRLKLNLRDHDFHAPWIEDRVGPTDWPLTWLDFEPSQNMGHLLSYPWLFHPSTVVTYFRTINYSGMFRSFETSKQMSAMIGRMDKIVGIINDPEFLGPLVIDTTRFLVLEIRRDNIARDALSQLWRRQRKELFRPLRVKMGMDEGEEGVDAGGVQQEFFRLAVAEFLDPEYGLFDVDETTKMTWFRPCSRSPLYHFALIGLLMGLAIYNSITLPVTFPLAFYRKLLGLPVESVDDIRDGWPTLAKGFSELLSWPGEDVEDVFSLTYSFPLDRIGSIDSIDMKTKGRDPAWLQSPTDPSMEEGADAVTNLNRAAYVADYIRFVADKSIAPQFNAFWKGFSTVLPRKALSLFSPDALRRVVEGSQNINVAGLQKTTRYMDGYSEYDQVIDWFWGTVRNFSPVELSKLLEFVTASERVPAKGIEEVQFIIQRSGADDKRLPTSMTCFGRLLLPEYSSKEILEDRIRVAIDYSRGFGVA